MSYNYFNNPPEGGEDEELNSSISASLLQEDEFRPGMTTSTNTNNNSTAAVTSSVPASAVYPMVQVVAPATLRAGYTFDVEVNRDMYTVTVPIGGIKMGQTFTVPTQPLLSDNVYRIPMRMWKDSLFDFCKYGPFHSSFLLSCLFPLVSLGQIYTRLELSWHGTPIPQQTNAHRSRLGFKIMVGMTLWYIFMKQIIASFELSYHTYYLLNMIYMTFIAVLVGKTRRYMRERYDIPSTFASLRRHRLGGGNGTMHDVDEEEDEEHGIVHTCCGELEDYALSAACYPCVVSQMNRHTAMYDTYEGSVCNSDGLPKHAPQII